MRRAIPLFLAVALSTAGAHAGQPEAEAPKTVDGYDAALAERLGADQYGMHAYVLVILRTGPTPLPPGPERDAMFRGHFANMGRLAGEGALVLAGPLDGVDGRRGIFILDVDSIEDARTLVATDPVIIEGEMVADYHRYYGSAALKMINELHGRISTTAIE